MRTIRRFGGTIAPLVGSLPHLDYHWDPETEILSGSALELSGEHGLTGTIELEDAKGAVLTVDFQGGVLRGLEIVVWPSRRTVADLRPPTAAEQGRYVVPARRSQPGVAVVEVDTALSAEVSTDESIIHLRVGPRRQAKPVSLADNLTLEVDGAGDIAGFWLLGVPPFPAAREA